MSDKDAKVQVNKVHTGIRTFLFEDLTNSWTESMKTQTWRNPVGVVSGRRRDPVVILDHRVTRLRRTDSDRVKQTLTVSTSMSRFKCVGSFFFSVLDLGPYGLRVRVRTYDSFFSFLLVVRVLKSQKESSYLV